jgi:hypothetical protein
MALANASVYEFTNHCSSTTEALSSTAMIGSAFVITRLSSVAMNIGSEAAISAAQSGTRRRCGSGGRGVLD